MKCAHCDIAVIGAGIIGISTAYYLMKNHDAKNIVLLEPHQPMGFTSAQSGDNYRNWWPTAEMIAFCDRATDLMENIDTQSDHRINLRRRGYVLASRTDALEAVVTQLRSTLGPRASEVRTHNHINADYVPSLSADWRNAPDGFDYLRTPELVRKYFPDFDPAVQAVLHIRRAGDFSSQQMGQWMLEELAKADIHVRKAKVTGIESNVEFRLHLDDSTTLSADKIINCAGPFAGEIAAMLRVDLPLYNVVQQKIAFPDPEGAIDRRMPFVIDIDGQIIDWNDEDRALLAADPDTAFLAHDMPGAIHCRPEGGDNSTWLKMGWAYNEPASDVSWEPPLDPRFPEIVLRGGAQLHPALKTYYGKLPRQMHHYGGYYTRTEDNWPLIGSMGPNGAYMACALSGHGSMCATATGELAAAWVMGGVLPDYADAFSLARFSDPSRRPERESGLL